MRIAFATYEELVQQLTRGHIPQRHKAIAGEGQRFRVRGITHRGSHFIYCQRLRERYFHRLPASVHWPDHLAGCRLPEREVPPRATGQQFAVGT